MHHPDPNPILDSPRPVQAANLAVVSEESASPEVRQLYQQFREDFGRPQVPGILQCFATHPGLLRHMLGMAKTMLFADGALRSLHKEMIAVFVSATNECGYCADSHAFFFRQHGGRAATLNAVLSRDLDSDAIDSNEETLLRFSKKITEASQDITPADIERVRSAGWSDAQIAEAIHLSALFACFNRVVNAFGLPSQELLSLLDEESRDAQR